MQRVLVMNPLRLRLPRPIFFDDFPVIIENIAVPRLEELRNWPPIRGIDLEGLKTSKFALTTRFDCQAGEEAAGLTQAWADVGLALVALQVISPSAEQDFRLSYKIGGVADPLAVGIPVNLIPPRWAGQLVWPLEELERIPLTVDRLKTVHRERQPRLGNALRLYWQGLRETDGNMRVLFWAMALDALTMAQSARNFCDRISAVLGGHSWIFPSTATVQPSYRVADVVSDLFQMRSELAHGSALNLKFAKVVGFLGDGGVTISEGDTRGEVLEQCCFFILQRMLKTALLTNVFDDIQHDVRLRRRLTGAWPPL